jgi:hypothetical protein
MSGYPPITCPICRSQAEQLDRIIDSDAIRCGTHGEFEFTGTARSEKSRDRKDWEKADHARQASPHLQHRFLIRAAVSHRRAASPPIALNGG